MAALCLAYSRSSSYAALSFFLSSFPLSLSQSSAAFFLSFTFLFLGFDFLMYCFVCFLFFFSLAFFGGTYFPPTDRLGRPGFKSILHLINQRYPSVPVSLLNQFPDLSFFLSLSPLSFEGGQATTTSWWPQGPRCSVSSSRSLA